jgi:tellurite resistance protein TehA-like permease
MPEESKLIVFKQPTRTQFWIFLCGGLLNLVSSVNMVFNDQHRPFLLMVGLLEIVAGPLMLWLALACSQTDQGRRG